MVIRPTTIITAVLTPIAYMAYALPDISILLGGLSVLSLIGDIIDPERDNRKNTT